MKGKPRIAAAVAFVIAACAAGCNGGDSDAERPTAPDGGRSLFVSPQGTASGTGTSSRPFRTIQRALDLVRAGDTVVVAAGAYPEDLTIARGGRSRLPVRLAGAAGERPVLTGRLKIEADHVVVSNLVFVGQTPANPDDVLVYISGGRSVRFEHNEVRSAGQSGIFVGEHSVDVTIDANWIHDNGKDRFLDHGIYYASGARGLVANNVIEDNAGYGIQLYPDSDDVLVTENTVTGNGRAGIIVGGEEGTTADRNTIANNIVAGNGAQGIRSYWGGELGRGNVAVNNLLWENQEDDHPEIRGLSVQNPITESPGFVDAASGNYIPRADSAAVGTGLTEYSTRADFRGTKRPQGDAPDLGAFERRLDETTS